MKRYLMCVVVALAAVAANSSVFAACVAKCRVADFFKSASDGDYYYIVAPCRRIWMTATPENDCVDGTSAQRNYKKVTVGAGTCANACRPNSGIHAHATCGSVTVQQSGMITCWPKCDKCDST